MTRKILDSLTPPQLAKLAALATADDWDDVEFMCPIGECDLCGGDGVRELHDAPEEWGEDFCAEENRLITCPECEEIEKQRRQLAAWKVAEREADLAAILRRIDNTDKGGNGR